MLGKTQQTILANGCRIVTAQMDTVESVSVGIDVGVGSRYEGPGEAGFCHFLEHLVFKGSAKRPSTEALMRPIEAVGGSMNAYTATDHTMFFAKVPFDALPLAGDTLFDLVLHPLLRAEDIGRERGVVFSEMDMAHDDDADYANECAQQSAWPGDPLGRPVLGSRDDLSAATDGVLRAFHRTHYTAGGTIIAAAGKLEHERFVDLVAPYASQIPEGVAPGFRPITAPPPQRRLFAEKRDALAGTDARRIPELRGACVPAAGKRRRRKRSNRFFPRWKSSRTRRRRTLPRSSSFSLTALSAG